MLETVMIATLSGVQDGISRARSTPWPQAPGTNDAVSAMPYPGARVVEGVLHAWFGNENDPALRLAPLSLSDLGL